MIHNPDLHKVYKEVALELGLPKDIVELAYREFWNFCRTTIEAIPLKKIETEEEFNMYRCNINVPGLGKLFTCWPRISFQKKHFKEYLEREEQELKEQDEDKEDKY